MSRPGRGSALYLLAIIALIAVLATAVIIALANHHSRADSCRERGGTVVTDVDHGTRTVTGRNGRPSRKPTTSTEYECIINGQEVDEWH